MVRIRPSGSVGRQAISPVKPEQLHQKTVSHTVFPLPAKPGPAHSGPYFFSNVVRPLIEESGVDLQMPEAGRYADTRPVEGNDTEAGKAVNRRIEIVPYLKELTAAVQHVP